MGSIFTDRHILITGACGGIGRATVHKLAAQGARLALADVDANTLETLAEERKDHGHTGFALAGNLADSTYCDDLPGKALEAWKPQLHRVQSASCFLYGKAVTAHPFQDTVQRQ